MASVDSSRSTEDCRAIVINFRCPRNDVPVWITSSVSNWEPIEMTRKEPHEGGDFLYEHTLMVSKDVDSILYKFRIGDHDWVSDTSAPAEHDGFGGANNRFDIPKDPEPAPNMATSGEPPRETNEVPVKDQEPEKKTELNEESEQAKDAALEEKVEKEQYPRMELKAEPAGEPDQEHHILPVEEPEAQPDSDSTKYAESGNSTDRMKEPEGTPSIKSMKGPDTRTAEQSYEETATKTEHGATSDSAAGHQVKDIPEPNTNGHVAGEHLDSEPENPSASEVATALAVQKELFSLDDKGKLNEIETRSHPQQNGAAELAEATDGAEAFVDEPRPKRIIEDAVTPDEQVLPRIEGETPVESLTKGLESVNGTQSAASAEAADADALASNGQGDARDPAMLPSPAESFAAATAEPSSEQSVEEAEPQEDSETRVNGAASHSGPPKTSSVGEVAKVLEVPVASAVVKESAHDVDRGLQLDTGLSDLAPSSKHDARFSYAMYFSAAALAVAIIGFMLRSR